MKLWIACAVAGWVCLESSSARAQSDWKAERDTITQSANKLTKDAEALGGSFKSVGKMMPHVMAETEKYLPKAKATFQELSTDLQAVTQGCNKAQKGRSELDRAAQDGAKLLKTLEAKAAEASQLTQGNRCTGRDLGVIKQNKNSLGKRVEDLSNLNERSDDVTADVQQAIASAASTAKRWTAGRNEVEAQLKGIQSQLGALDGIAQQYRSVMQRHQALVAERERIKKELAALRSKHETADAASYAKARDAYETLRVRLDMMTLPNPLSTAGPLGGPMETPEKLVEHLKAQQREFSSAKEKFRTAANTCQSAKDAPALRNAIQGTTAALSQHNAHLASSYDACRRVVWEDLFREVQANAALEPKIARAEEDYEQRSNLRAVRNAHLADELTQKEEAEKAKQPKSDPNDNPDRVRRPRRTPQ